MFTNPICFLGIVVLASLLEAEGREEEEEEEGEKEKENVCVSCANCSTAIVSTDSLALKVFVGWTFVDWGGIGERRSCSALFAAFLPLGEPISASLVSSASTFNSAKRARAVGSVLNKETRFAALSRATGVPDLRTYTNPSIAAVPDNVAFCLHCSQRNDI